MPDPTAPTPRAGQAELLARVYSLDLALLLYVLLSGLVILAFVLPFGLGAAADPVHTPAGIKPQWYFLAVYQLLKLVPLPLGVLAVGVFFAAMFAWPWLARRHDSARVVRATGGGVLLLFVLLTLLGAVSGETVRLGPLRLGFTYHGLPHAVAGTDGERQR